MAGVYQGIHSGNLEGTRSLGVIAVAPVDDASTDVAGEVELSEGMGVLEEEVARELLGVDILFTIPTVRLGLSRSCLTLGAEIAGYIQTSAGGEVQPRGDIRLQSEIAINAVALLVVDTLIGKEICIVLSGKGTVLLEICLILPIMGRQLISIFGA